MNKLEKALNEINLIERLSLKNTIIHKLKPISKLAVTIIYIVMVTSCYRYSIPALLPWFIYPIVILILSELPIIQTLKRLLIIVPVILFIGIGNIFFNNNEVVVFGIKTTFGVVSFVTFAIKSILSLTVLYEFICTTGIYNLAYGLIKLKFPEIFVWILVLLYRYIFVIIEQLNTITKAYSLIAPNQKGFNIKVWGSLLGNLFYRTLERGKDLYNSMYLRGFGENKAINSNIKFHFFDYIFILVSLLIFVLLKGLVK